MKFSFWLDAYLIRNGLLIGRKHFDFCFFDFFRIFFDFFSIFDWISILKEAVVVTTTTAEPTTTTTETPLVDECANGSHNCDANAVCFDEPEVRYLVTF